MPVSFIVLTNFYSPAMHALRYADALASSVGGRLVLLHANRASLYDPYVFAGDARRRQELSWEMDAGSLLTQLAAQLRAPATVELTTDLLPAVAQDLTERYGPALFVLGLPATDHTPDQPVSKAALELLRAAGFPLLLVPVHHEGPALPRRVLLAADREAFELPASSEVIRQLLAHLGPEVTVAHVSAVEDDVACAQALRGVQHSGLVAGAATLDLRGYCNRHTTEGLLGAVAELQPGLVLLLARPRSYFGELFHQSVTSQLIARCPVPVLVVPIAEPAAQAKRPRATDSALLWPQE